MATDLPTRIAKLIEHVNEVDENLAELIERVDEIDRRGSLARMNILETLGAEIALTREQLRVMDERLDLHSALFTSTVELGNSIVAAFSPFAEGLKLPPGTPDPRD